jgi:hypothetical protein
MLSERASLLFPGPVPPKIGLAFSVGLHFVPLRLTNAAAPQSFEQRIKTVCGSDHRRQTIPMPIFKHQAQIAVHRPSITACCCAPLRSKRAIFSKGEKTRQRSIFPVILEAKKCGGQSESLVRMHNTVFNLPPLSHYLAIAAQVSSPGWSW